VSDVLLAVALLPLLGWGMVAAFRSPVWVVAAYAGIVPFGSLFHLPIGLAPPYNSLTTLFGLVAGTALIVYLVRNPRRTSPPNPVLFVWLVFLAISALTYLWSVNRSATFDQLLVLATLVGLYAPLVAWGVKQSEIRLIEIAIILGGAATGMYAVYQLVTSSLPISGEGVARFQTTGSGGTGAGDPNITAAALLLPLALGLAEAFASRGRRRLLALGAVALMVTAIVLTASRGGLLGMILVAVVVSFNFGRPSLIIVPGLLLAAAIAVSPGSLVTRVQSAESTGRVEVWTIGMRACVEHCWLGSGLGTFPDVHEQELLKNPELGSRQLRFEAHNIWVGVAVEVGFVGVALLGLGAVLTWSGLLGVPRRWRGGGLAGLAGVLVANLFVSNLEFKYFWLMLAYSALVTQVHQADYAFMPADIRKGATVPV